MADQLVTPLELAAYLQQDLDTATATLLVEQGTAVVQAAAGQRLVQVTDDVITRPGGSGRFLTLPERPVTAVTAVTIDGIPIAAGTGYVAYLPKAQLWRVWGWRSLGPTSWTGLPFAAVQVTYSHGYAAGDQKLEKARSCVFALCAQAYANPTGASTLAIDDYRESYTRPGSTAAMQLADTQQAELRRYYGTTAGSVRLVRAWA